MAKVEVVFHPFVYIQVDDEALAITDVSLDWDDSHQGTMHKDDDGIYGDIVPAEDELSPTEKIACELLDDRSKQRAIIAILLDPNARLVFDEVEPDDVTTDDS